MNSCYMLVICHCITSYTEYIASFNVNITCTMHYLIIYWSYIKKSIDIYLPCCGWYYVHLWCYSALFGFSMMLSHRWHTVLTIMKIRNECERKYNAKYYPSQNSQLFSARNNLPFYSIWSSGVVTDWLLKASNEKNPQATPCTLLDARNHTFQSHSQPSLSCTLPWCWSSKERTSSHPEYFDLVLDYYHPFLKLGLLIASYMAVLSDQASK